MTPKNLYGFNTLDRLIRFTLADVLAWLFPSGSDTTTDLNARDMTSNRDFHVGNAFSVLSGTGVTHAQQLTVFGSPNGGRAQLEIQTVDGFQTTALQNWRDHDGDVICSVMPDGFAGPAPGITAVPAASLTGTVANARLDPKLAAFAASSVVLASQLPDIEADYDESTGTGTDNAPFLQAVLDGGNVHLIFDTPVGVATELKLYSNTTIDILRPGDGPCKIGKHATGATSDGKPVLRNGNLVPWPGTPRDENITVRNLYVNGGRKNRASANPGSYSRNTLGNGQSIPAVMFAGVTNLQIGELYVKDAVTYALTVANCTGRLDHLHHERNEADPMQAAADLISPYHNGSEVAILGIHPGTHDFQFGLVTGDCWDDAVEVWTGSHAAQQSAGYDFQPGVWPLTGAAPVERVHLERLEIGECYGLIRFVSALATGYIDMTVGDCVAAKIRQHGVYFDSSFVPDDGGTNSDGHGRYRNIKIRSIECHPHSLVDDAHPVKVFAAETAQVGTIEVGSLYTTCPGYAVVMQGGTTTIGAPSPGQPWWRGVVVHNLRNAAITAYPVIDLGSPSAEFTLMNSEVVTNTATTGATGTCNSTTVPAGTVTALTGVGVKNFINCTLNSGNTAEGVPISLTATGGSVLLAGVTNLFSATPAIKGTDTIGVRGIVNVLVPPEATVVLNRQAALWGTFALLAGHDAADFSMVVNNMAGTLNHFAVRGDGLPVCYQLPTADPHVAGGLWSNSNVVTRSTG